MEIRSFSNAPFTFMQHEGRDKLCERYMDGTLDSYENTRKNTWFVEAVEHRIKHSDFIVEAHVEGCAAGYMGVDNMRILGAGLIAYVGIATVFPWMKKHGIMQYLLGSLQGYDGIMIRTQNPGILFSMYQVFGDVMPVTEEVTLLARHCAKTLAQLSGGKYDEEKMVSPGLYNGKSLTGTLQSSGRAWADKAMHERINAEKGDAQILVTLFAKPKRSGF